MMEAVTDECFKEFWVALLRPPPGSGPSEDKKLVDVVEAEVVWTIAWRSCRGAGLNNILADKECEGAESEEWSMNVSRSSGLPSSDLLPVAEI